MLTARKIWEKFCIGAIVFTTAAYVYQLGVAVAANEQVPSRQEVCYPRRLVRTVWYNQKTYAVCGDTINEPELRMVP